MYTSIRNVLQYCLQVLVYSECIYDLCIHGLCKFIHLLMHVRLPVLSVCDIWRYIGQLSMYGLRVYTIEGLYTWAMEFVHVIDVDILLYLLVEIYI